MKVEEIRATDGGEFMGWVLYGDVDDLDVDLLIAEEGAEYDVYAPDGFDVIPCYVRKVPINEPDHEMHGGFRFVYTDKPGRGASKCTRVEVAHLWPHWCHNHIWERASAGIPVERVSNPIYPFVSVRIASPEERARAPRYRQDSPMDGEAYVYLCRACHRSYSARYELATAERMLEFYESREGDDNARYAERTRARIEEQRKTVALMDEMKERAA